MAELTKKKRVRAGREADIIKEGIFGILHKLDSFLAASTHPADSALPRGGGEALPSSKVRLPKLTI